jgi:hypothetical protein
MKLNCKIPFLYCLDNIKYYLVVLIVVSLSTETLRTGCGLKFTLAPGLSRALKIRLEPM